jgi:hypothetical protein
MEGPEPNHDRDRKSDPYEGRPPFLPVLPHAPKYLPGDEVRNGPGTYRPLVTP